MTPRRSSTVGRKPKPFVESSKRSQRRKAATIRQQYNRYEIAYAAQASLRAVGQNDAATIVKEIKETTPERGRKILIAYKTSSANAGIRPYTPDEALALMID
uniref:Uncharacterized protein n=1 Tax=Phlebotomus papatasi TaxID=29031 RepID=A0A1B0DLR6_PHLPP